MNIRATRSNIMMTRPALLSHTFVASSMQLMTYLLLLASCSNLSINNQLVGASRLDLLQRAGGFFSSFASSTSQAERKSSLEHMSQRERNRTAYITAKLLAMSADNDQVRLQRSASALDQTPLYSGQIVDSGNYIIKVGLGTPAHEVSMVIDTGSDLAWTQCLPCAACYSQRDAIFNPTASSSYKKVPCASELCSQLGTGSAGTCSGAACQYQISYLDGSYTTGDFAMDTLSVSGERVSDAYPFGCGHENQGFFTGFDGLMGLSRSSLAFPAQTRAEFGGVFAYCMPPVFSSTAAGYVEFGKGAASAASMSTPLLALSSLYVVELQSIGVKGVSSSNVLTSKPKNRGLFVVDSGTVITRLDMGLYTEVRDAFKQAASSSDGVKEAPAGAGMGFFDPCYVSSDAGNFPSVTFTFMGGPALTLPAQNMVIPMDDKDTYCLALLPIDSPSGVSILGNYQQQRHLFTFDIASSTLSISSHTC